MFRRILALSLIVACTSGAWALLATVLDQRSKWACGTVSEAVCGLWGDENVQISPQVKAGWMAVGDADEADDNLGPNRLAPVLSGSSIEVDLDLDYRKKGLLWFSTYQVNFAAQYTIENPSGSPAAVTVIFPPPSKNALYENIVVEAPGSFDLQYEARGGADARTAKNTIVAAFTVPAESAQVVNFRYQSRGRDLWAYRVRDDAGMVKDFHLTMTTNFPDIDFPRDAISPDQYDDVKTESGDGKFLTWDKDLMVSAFQIGMVMPRLINPGPLAAAMSRHAPVSLLFFFFVMFLLQTKRGIKLHPMNYFFIAAGFFAFNLLFSYLVNLIDLKAAFIIASTTSIFMVVSYLVLAAGVRFGLVEAGLCQFFYQSLFAFAHFYEGYTGLAVTVGAILTLTVLMWTTAKVDWEEIFRDKEAGRKAPPPRTFTPPPLNPEVPRG